MRASDLAYNTLRTDILDGRLQPGEPLGEVEQSARLGISRTPLREALARLEADGLVTGDRGRGMVVTDLSPASVAQLYELRQALEGHSIALAARRADPAVVAVLADRFAAAAQQVRLDDASIRDYYDLVEEFDAAVDAAIANPYLVTALASIRTHLARIRRVSRDNATRLAAAAEEHALIAHAIADRDAVLAEAATEVHLRRSLDTVRDTFASAEPTTLAAQRTA